jgi:rubrerythrin
MRYAATRDALANGEQRSVGDDVNRFNAAISKVRTETVMFCDQCGEALLEQSKFCPHCGALRVVPVPTNQDKERVPPPGG